MANLYTDYPFVLVNTKTGERKESSIPLENEDAFLKWLAQQNLQAPPGWAFMRVEPQKNG